MRNPIKILLLTLILGFSSCSSSFIVRTKKKSINIKTLPESSIKVEVDNGDFQITFSRNDLINLFDEDLKNWFNPRIKLYVDELKSLKSDTIIIKDKVIGTLQFTEYELKFHNLILKGMVEIENKKTGKNLNRIKYKFTRDKLGGKNAYFYTEDGTEFYDILLAFGE